jgi:hypothetical protein
MHHSAQMEMKILHSRKLLSDSKMGLAIQRHTDIQNAGEEFE